MKKMSKGMLMTALICGAVYMGATPVYANDVQEFTLDEYVVTAARTETKLVDTPANISVVDAKTIEERHYQDVSEVLKDVPGATVLDSGVGAFEKKIMLNGDSRVLVMVDGRRVNMGISPSSGKATFDFNLMPEVKMVERIEILKGAGGALYGSEAVGGVINIITKKANASNGKASIGFGSHDYREMSTMYSHKEGSTGITVSAAKDKQGYYEYKDAKSGKIEKWPGSSKYENEKVSIKIEQELKNNDNLVVGYDYSKYEGSNPGDITGSMAADLRKETNNFFLKYDWILNNENDGYVQVYRNELEYDNYADGYEGFYKDETSGVDVQQSIKLSDRNKMVVGSSWRKTDVNLTGPHSYSARYNDSIDNLAFFINDTWEFASSWLLNTGVRYDNHSESGSETTLSFGLNKKFNDNSHAYINWGQVFKAPTMDELYYPTGGNPNLTPETGETWTIGYATKLGERSNVGINYFESDLDDAIRWYDPDPTNDWSIMDGYYENVDKQKSRGFEVTLNREINKNLDIEATYTYVKVEENKGTGFYRDDNAIPNIYRMGLKYYDGKWNANLFMRAGTGASNMKYVDSSFLTVDMTVTYKATEDLNFYAKAYNLFNEGYAEHGGLVYGTHKHPAQSRRFIVGAEYKF